MLLSVIMICILTTFLCRWAETNFRKVQTDPPITVFACQSMSLQCCSSCSRITRREFPWHLLVLRAKKRYLVPPVLCYLVPELVFHFFAHKLWATENFCASEDEDILLADDRFWASQFSPIPEFYKVNGFQPSNSLNLFDSEEMLKNNHVTINIEVD